MDKDLIEEELAQISRRGLFLKGGAAAAGLTVLGSPAAAAFAASNASTFKVAVARTATPGRSGRSSRRASTRPRKI